MRKAWADLGSMQEPEQKQGEARRQWQWQRSDSELYRLIVIPSVKPLRQPIPSIRIHHPLITAPHESIILRWFHTSDPPTSLRPHPLRSESESSFLPLVRLPQETDGPGYELSPSSACSRRHSIFSPGRQILATTAASLFLPFLPPHTLHHHPTTSCTRHTCTPQFSCATSPPRIHPSRTASLHRITPPTILPSPAKPALAVRFTCFRSC
jgi:hypothetical protein